MQFRYFVFFLFIFLLWPVNNLLALSQHFSPADLQQEANFISSGGNFQLSIPANQYQLLDVYLFELPKDQLPQNIKPVTPIYSYYLYSSEVTESSIFNITLSFNNENSSGKLILFWDEQKKSWQPGAISYDNQRLTIKLKGRKNKVIAVEAGAREAKSQEVEAADGILTVKLPKSLNGEIVTTKIEPFISLNYPENKKRVSSIYQLDFQADDGSDLQALLADSVKKAVCETYLTSNLSPYSQNAVQVKKLQEFLSDEEGFSEIKITGQYDTITLTAIIEFQEKYASDILAPWGLKKGTGNVFKTTLKKINQLHCDNQAKKNAFIELEVSYESENNQAKSLYYWDRSQEQWIVLPSFDNFETKNVTALTNLPFSQVALFEEENQWVGEASWYAWKNGFFAASRDFPKGTKLKVINQTSGRNRGKSVIITVNDYGPEAWTGRIIDLDKVAFEQIGSLAAGVMPVRVELIKNND